MRSETTLAHGEFDVQFVKHIRKILASEKGPASCAMLSTCLGFSTVGIGSPYLLGILHDHIYLIHRMIPNCHVQDVDDIGVFQRP